MRPKFGLFVRFFFCMRVRDFYCYPKKNAEYNVTRLLKVKAKCTVCFSCLNQIQIVLCLYAHHMHLNNCIFQFHSINIYNLFMVSFFLCWASQLCFCFILRSHYIFVVSIFRCSHSSHSIPVVDYYHYVRIKPDKCMCSCTCVGMQKINWVRRFAIIARMFY